MQQMSFLPSFDRPLVGRVRKYLSDHRLASSDELTEYLRRKYPDYGKRKKNAFGKLVRQVHDALLSEKKLTQSNDNQKLKRRKPGEGRNSETNSDSEKEENLMEYADTNSLNSSMMSMYKRKKRKSFSAPASPADSFSYVDCPMRPGGEIFVEKTDENANHCAQNDTDNSDVVSSKLKTETAASLVESFSPSKSVSSNIVPSDAVILAESKSQIPHRQTRKKKKVLRAQDPDIEITGEKRSNFQLNKSDVKFDDIGGNKEPLTELLMSLLYIKNSFDRVLGVAAPCGVLLHGPTGCGKTLLANAIAGELDMPMLTVASAEIVRGVSGESEERIRDIFELADASAPCIVFFDEIDTITQKRENASKDMERRIVSQLLTCMDNLSKSPSQVLVLAATNQVDSIDPALRREGRFAKEFCIGIPNENDRLDILRILCKNLKLEEDFNFALLARLTPGYVGGDLKSLLWRAAVSALNRKLCAIKANSSKNHMQGQIQTDNSCGAPKSANHDESMEVTCDEIVPSRSVDSSELTYSDYLHWLRNPTLLSESILGTVCIQLVDFKNALPHVTPIAKKEGFATVPDVTWDDIGALESIRDELTMAILAPVRNPRKFAALGLTKPRGILLAGPPGCGKTLLAKAIANESGVNFISVKGPELMNMYVGESEKAVRRCFERARNSSPCVIFFDELDSLCPTRSGTESGVTARVVNQMLTEMDGLNVRGNVFVMAATNRPDIIDPAVLRPGRIEKTLYVGLPNADDRAKILQTVTKNGTKPPISSSVSLDAIARDERCSRFTGADLSSLVRGAAENALREHLSIDHAIGQDEGLEVLDIRVSPAHFELSLLKTQASVSPERQLEYEEMRRKLEM